MKKCLSCGKEVPIDSIFCPFCGSKEIKDDNTCPNCKKVVPADSVFCPFCGEKIKDEGETETVVRNAVVPDAKEQVNETKADQTDPGFFKRFLSWVVLAACFVVALIVFSIAFMIVDYIVDLIEDLPSFLKIVVYIFGGGTFIFGIISFPYNVGLPMIIGASEAVCPSKNGLRYLVFGGFIAVDYLWAFVSNFLNHHISVSHLVVGLFGIGIAYFGKSASKTL